VLTETMQALPDDVRERAARNLLVGLAMDEYRDEFRRGDFLIRNIMGADRESGAIAIGAYPRVGQTIQFHMRDAEAADDELRLMLEAAGLAMHGAGPAGAVVCSCNGRGQGLFGAPDHDAAAVQQRFGALPVAGFFCNGEIGPVGGTNFVHGFTASIGFFVPNS
jgi:small ligand-binding sensory domain FIST